LIYTWRRKLLDAGAEREPSAPEALSAPMFAKAMVGEDLLAAASRAEHP
jgi:transposase